MYDDAVTVSTTISTLPFTIWAIHIYVAAESTAYTLEKKLLTATSAIYETLIMTKLLL